MEKNYINAILMNKPVPQNSYLASLPVVQHLIRHKRLPLSKKVTFFVGENGTGKSTLLEAAAVAFGFNAEGGSKNFRFSTKSTHSELYRYLTLSKSAFAKDGFFLRAESFYNVASTIDELDETNARTSLLESYGGASLHTLSHGESFLALIQNRFLGHGLYILDEPEAALSPSRTLTLLAQIHELVQHDSQFIIATHSPILMAYPGAQIYQMTSTGIDTVSYKETEHYQLTRRFLEAPERMLNGLLEE